MPSFPRHVAFAPTQSVSRPARDEEHEAIRNFARHASHCEHCADAHGSYRAGMTLCERGHRYARHVNDLLYSSKGRVFSVLDEYDGRGGQQPPAEVEIPRGYESVRSLLKALERGLRLRRYHRHSHSPVPAAAAASSASTTVIVPPPQHASPAVYYSHVDPRSVVRPRAVSPPPVPTLKRANTISTTTAAAAAASRRPHIEIVEPPYYEMAETATYINRDGSPYQGSRQLVDYEYGADDDYYYDNDEVVVYARPRAETQYWPGGYYR
jgi:hypothetical protein